MIAEELRFPGRVELAALRFNGGAPRRALALHGWLDNAMSFAGLAAELPDVELIALDFAGHGRSGHLPPGGWYAFIDYLDDACAALRALDPAPTLLFGHSLGGAVATVLAAAMPQAFERLVLIESLGPLAMRGGVAVDVLRRGLAERQRIAGKQRRVFDSPDVAVAARLQANVMAPGSAQQLISRGLDRVDGGWQWASDPRLTVTTPARYSEATVLEWIAGVEAPTLVIAADQHPPYFDPDARTRRVERLRNGTVRVLPGHHHLHMDDPAAVAAEIRRFIDA